MAEPAAEPGVSEPETEAASEAASEAAPEAPTPAGPTGSVGIDIGADRMVVAISTLRRAATAILVRNEVSNEATPAIVAFKGDERFLGEAAKSQYTRNITNTVVNLPLLLGATTAPEGSTFAFEDGKVVADFKLGEDAGPVGFEPEALLAMLLARYGCERAVRETIANNFGEEVAASGYEVTVAVPSYFDSAQKQAVADACGIAGLPLHAVIPAHVALTSQYTCRHAATLVKFKTTTAEEPGDSHTVMFIDVGATQVTASVAKFTTETTVGAMVMGTRPKGTCLSVVSESGLGGGAIDAAIFHHWAAETTERFKETPTMASRRGVRLLTQAEKAKKVLSSVAETEVVCENLVEDTDVRFTLKRSVVEELCAGTAAAITALVAKTLADSGVAVEDLHAVELVGGGMRTPLVQAAIAAALGGAEKLAFTMDSAAAVVMGAACSGAGLSGITVEDVAAEAAAEAAGLGAEAIAALAEREVQMAAQAEVKAAMERCRSEYEAYLFSMRNDMDSGKHKDKLDRAVIGPLLEAAEEWLYSDAGYDASLEDLSGKLATLQAAVLGQSAEYRAAIEADKLAMEEELKVAEAQRIAEEALSGGDSDTKLPYKQRMRKVELNKQEGNDLVKDGNFGEGLKRYANALNHCTKFFDLGPEQMEELKTVRLSLYNNSAMCGNKLEDWATTIENCKKALEIDITNVKALFRRATAYEKTKRYDDAKADLETAQTISPADKAVAKALVRVGKLKDKELAKEKKMYGKMFG